MNTEERQIYFEGFKQGKKDALEMCDSCKHKVSAEDIKQIRAVVIEEFESLLYQFGRYEAFAARLVIYQDDLEKLIEQLKGQSNG